MNRLFTLALVFICLTGYAQPQAVLELDKKNDIIDIVSLGNNGFVIETGSGKEIQLTSFRADLSQRWALNLQTTANISSSNRVIVSSSANATYFVDNSEFSTESKSLTIHIVRIDSIGKREDIDYKINRDEKTTESIALFADDDNLYRLGTITTFTPEKGKDYPAMGKKEGKIILFIMNKSGKEVRSVETDIKLTADHVLCNGGPFMEYLGNDSEYIYLAKRIVNRSQSIITYEVMRLDKSGKTIGMTQFSASINGKITQAMNNRNVPGAVVYSNDYSSWTPDRVVLYRNHSDGMYGCIKLDMDNGYLYIYGLSRNNRFPITKNQSGDRSPNEETNANGYYVYKYDFNTGNLISKNEIPFDKSILEDYPFSNPSFGFSEDRFIWFDIVDSETVRIGGTSVASYGLLHIIVFNTRTGKTAYIGKNVKERFAMTGIYYNRYQRKFFANAMVTRLDASKETIDYINKFPDFNGKKLKVLGICLKGKTILVLDNSLTKTRKVEFHLLDNTNR